MVNSLSTSDHYPNSTINHYKCRISPLALNEEQAYRLVLSQGTSCYYGSTVGYSEKLIS